jgi:endonuclease/exonuclease/phosphatase family metal-dependent hydrolase
MSKNALLGVSAAVLLCAGGCGRGRQLGVEQVRFSSSPYGVYKVMTYNIRVDTILDGFHRWGRRKGMVVDTLADHAPDVIGLQEVLDRQLEDIQEALPQYDAYAVGRTDGEDKGESCPILFRRDRFGFLDSGTFWFSDTPEEPGSKDWGNVWPRICSWVHIFELETGFSFYVYNVHLSCFSQNSRRKSVELLAQRIADRKVPDPFVVTGDFNMEIDNPAMRFLQQADYTTPYPKMVDAWHSVNLVSSRRGTSPGSGRQIDHIPISEGGRALSAQIDSREVDGRYPSDHFPVVAEIAFDRTPSPGLRASF